MKFLNFEEDRVYNHEDVCAICEDCEIGVKFVMIDNNQCLSGFDIRRDQE